MKIPAQAKKVFQGDIFSIYQWPQKNFAGKIEIYEMVKRHNTVEILAITADKKIIIIKQKQPNSKNWYYCTPGGRFTDKETPLHAALREFEEETGYAPKKIKPWFNFYPTPKLEWVMYYFLATGCVKKTKQHLDDGEKIQLKLCSFDEFLNLAEKKDFHIAEQIKLDMIKAKYNKEFRKKYKKLLLG